MRSDDLLPRVEPTLPRPVRALMWLGLFDEFDHRPATPPLRPRSARPRELGKPDV